MNKEKRESRKNGTKWLKMVNFCYQFTTKLSTIDNDNDTSVYDEKI